MSTEALYLAEIQAYDPSIGTTRILRFANREFRTKPSESPANTPYELCLEQPADIKRTLFAPGATRGRSTRALGDLVLLNPDGDLDYLNELAFDARTVTIRRTTKSNPSYPTDFTSITLTMSQPVCDNARVTLKLRDRFYEVAAAKLQTNKYLGNNALPAGLEGTAELAGKPKPVGFGVMQEVPAPCVNTSKLIYQVNDGAVASVDAVRDRGDDLIPSPTWVAGAASADCVKYAGGLFLAGTAAGAILTSPDGVTWTSRKTGLGSVLDFTYGGGVYLCITSSTFATSPDGITWTTRTAPTLQSGNAFRGCTYHEAVALFIIGGTGGEIYTSPDAVTWTQRAAGTATPGPNPNPDGLWSAAYGNGIAVLAGAGGLVLSSPNGTVWTKRLENSNVSYDATFSIAFGNDRFVAVGAGPITTSIDGITWTRIQNTKLFFGVMFANGLFIAPTFDVSPTIFSSIDGFTWLETKAPYAGFTTAGKCCAASASASVIASATLLKSQIASYASLTDLQNNDLAPLAGCYTQYAAGGYFRLGGTPDGIITADATEGAASANRTAAQIANRVLSRVPGSPSFDAGDVTALDALDDSPCGYWTIDDSVTCDQALDFLVGTPGAAWFPDKSGAFRIQRFDAPSGTPVITLTKNDVIKDKFTRVTSNDQGNGIPLYQVVVQYGRFCQTITTDIAGAVSDAARADFAQEWRNALSTDLTVLTAHPSASVLTIQSAYANKADAQAEADRQLALRKAKRDLFEITVELNDETDTLELNNVIEFVHPRYSLSVIGSPSEAMTGIGTTGGGLFRILDAQPNAQAKELKLTIWGRSREWNGETDTELLMVTSSGDFGVAARTA